MSNSIRVYHRTMSDCATFRHRGQVLTALRGGDVFVDEEGLTPSGHSLPGYEGEYVSYVDCRPATEAEIAALVEVEAQAKAKAEAAAEAKRRAERANAEAAEKVETLLAGLTCSGGAFDLGDLAETSDRETVATWRQGGLDCALTRLTLDGQTCYLRTTSSFDDDRMELYGPRPVIERAWAAWMERSGVTAEQAREWLRQYRGCYGTEAYEFAAKR